MSALVSNNRSGAGGESRVVNPWLIALTVILPTTMELLDSSIANVSVPHIAHSLSAGMDQSTWILSSYLVSNAIVLPLTGWFSRLVGRKNYFIGCTLIFTLSSLLCGLATTLPLLVFFRIIQGAGGGGLQPVSQAVLVDTFQREKHGIAMAVYGMGAVSAPTLGPTIGGWITDHYTWRWIFLINIPIGIISILLSSYLLSDPPHAAKVPGSRQRIDYIGLGLLTLGLGFAQVVLDTGQRDNWFRSHFIILATITASLALVGMVIWEFKIENPIVELHLLLDRNFVISTSMMFTLGFIMYSTLVMLPIFLQTVLGFTAEQSGLVILPGGLVTMVMLPFVGRILGKVQPKWLIMTGFTILAIGILQLTHLKFGVGMRTPAGYWMISRLGTSCLWVPTNVMAFYYVSRTKTNQATGLINLARNIGASMGISFMTTFLYSRAQHHLDRLSGYATGVDLRHLAAVQGHAQDFVYQGLQRQAMLLSFDDSFRVTAIIAIAVIPLLFLAKAKPHADSKTIAG